MDKIAVLIPCYNEAKTIEKVVCDFKAALPEAVIYVYDNNSTDQTSQLASDAGAIVKREPQQGKGNVIRRMFREIEAQCYILVDGDDTYPAEAAVQMAQTVLDEQVDMVVGDRLSSTYFTQNKRMFHNFGNTLVRTVINRLFSSDIKDIMTGYRAFSYLFVKSYPVLSAGFEIETDMTVHAIYRKMNVKNQVIAYRDRPEGSVSKLDTGKDGMKVLLTIAKLFKNYRPFAFFTTLSVLIILISILFVLPVLQDYFATGLVERFPTLITCLFGMLSGLLLFICGLILSSMQEKDKRDFEQILQRTQYHFEQAIEIDTMKDRGNSV